MQPDGERDSRIAIVHPTQAVTAEDMVGSIDHHSGSVIGHGAEGVRASDWNPNRADGMQNEVIAASSGKSGIRGKLSSSIALSKIDRAITALCPLDDIVARQNVARAGHGHT